VDLDDLRASRAAVVTVAEATSVFGVDVRTVRRAIGNGELTALRLGRRVLIPRLPLLAALYVEAGAAPAELWTSSTTTGEHGARRRLIGRVRSLLLCGGKVCLGGLCGDCVSLGGAVAKEVVPAEVPSHVWTRLVIPA
jgi:excisionase family DNA binding protein